jgi:hypothetical protein
MTHGEATALLVSAITSTYLATQSAVVAGTAAAAVILLKITDCRGESLGHAESRRTVAGAEEERS